jgi:hypothetical protein
MDIATRAVWPNVWRFLITGLRCVLPLRVDTRPLQAAGPEPIILGLLTLVMTTAQAWQLAGEGAGFNAYGLTSFLAAAALSPAVLSLLHSDQRVFDIRIVVALIFAASFWQFGLIIAAIALWPFILERLPSLADGQIMLVFGGSIAVLVWVIVAVWRIGRLTTTAGTKRIGGWLVATTLAATFLLPTSMIIRGQNDAVGESPGLLQTGADLVQSAFKPARATVAMPDARPDYEALLYRQPALLDAALARLLPSRADQPEVYFLGAAPYAAQGVFMRETQSIQRIVDDRLATAGRSLLLINHRDTHDTTPLANRISLDIALERIGRLMATEKDVLLLYVTSHGTPGEVSVSMPGVSSKSITPQELRASLDRAGIKRRVVVVSACYAGSFIEALAEPHTAVFTAARADRTSFGCSDARDWTYFGDALFNYALRETRSLPDAFERAKSLVSEWEAKQGLSPASEPQASIGADIAAHLATIAARLDERRAAP